MNGRAAVVLDIGKTHAKLTLWSANRRALVRRVHRNARARGPQYAVLDVEGIEAWLAQTLAEFARLSDVGVIIPIAHGAAAALVREDGLWVPPMDYEDGGGEAGRAAYDLGRDPFSVTGSPILPAGLNLGFQLHRLQALHADWPGDVQILTWPQYWSWRLSGVPATEVSSLGCHTDLWRPFEGRVSDLATRRGWADRLAPPRRAGEVLGPITADWASRTGLPHDCVVLCGAHDSNAGLLAALGHPELADADATVLSTGTWFVAMRATPSGQGATFENPASGRDCLVNVDVHGRPVLSSRFMGGREFEALGAPAAGEESEAEQEAALQALISAGAMVLPSFALGFGPFAQAAGRWIAKPVDALGRRLAISLYLALVADTALDLIGSRDSLLVEGRFAEDLAFVRALATLRPDQRIYTSSGHDDVGYGALRLMEPALPPPSRLQTVTPLTTDLAAYRRLWGRLVSGADTGDAA